MARALWILVAFPLVAHSASTARAFCRLKVGTDTATCACVSGGLPLAWHRRCISYSVGSPKGGLEGDKARLAIERAFQTWEVVQCGSGKPFGIEISEHAPEIVPDLCLQPEHNVNGRNANAIVFVDAWSRRGNGSSAFALSSVWHSTRTGQILDVDIEVNDSVQDRLRVCPEIGCAAGKVDLQNVLTHEIGHFLGLAHSADVKATMACQATSGELHKRTLAQDDVDGICAVYEGVVLKDGCDPRPINGWAAGCAVPLDGCGCVVPGRARPAAWLALLMLPALVLALGRRRPRDRKPLWRHSGQKDGLRCARQLQTSKPDRDQYDHSSR